MPRGFRDFLLPYWLYRINGGTAAALEFSGDASGSEKNGRKRRVLDSILHFLRALYNPEGLRELIRWGGAPLVCLIVFVETGLFVGFFLPGDSLLVTAGIFAAADVVPLRWLLFPVMACAIVGDQLGYWIGRSAGKTLYQREDSFLFRRSHLQ